MHCFSRTHQKLEWSLLCCHHVRVVTVHVVGASGTLRYHLLWPLATTTTRGVGSSGREYSKRSSYSAAAARSGASVQEVVRHPPACPHGRLLPEPAEGGQRGPRPKTEEVEEGVPLAGCPGAHPFPPEAASQATEVGP